MGQSIPSTGDCSGQNFPCGQMFPVVPSVGVGVAARRLQ